MPYGPGKYDDACTVARAATDAVACILIVVDGKLGHGFSVQAPPEIVLALPVLLRDVARRIERNSE